MPSVIRNNKDLVKGDQLWLFISKVTKSGDTYSVAEEATPIAFATSCSLNRSLSTNSVSSKDHGTSSYVTPGDGSWTASTEALYSINTPTGAIGFDTLMTAFDSGQQVNVTFGYVADAGVNIVATGEGATGPTHDEWTISQGWKGKGYITSLQASGSHGDAASYSCEITGIGGLESYTASNNG